MVELFYNFNGLNKQIFLIINRITNASILPDILQLISLPFVIYGFVIYYCLFCIYFHSQLRELNDIAKIQFKFWLIYNRMINIGIIYAIFGLTYAVLKFSINLPRPFCSLDLDQFLTIINTRDERCLSSFPSAHTGLAMLISYFIWRYLKHYQKIIAFLIVLLVGISRISLAMHYPSDIIYSFFISGLVILIGNFIFKILRNNFIKKAGDLLCRIYLK